MTVIAHVYLELQVVSMSLCVSRLSRFTSMASRQETADAEAQDQSDGYPSQNKTRNQSLDGRPVRPDVRCGFASLQEKLDPALDPSSLPPPDPSLQAGTGSVNGAADQSGGVACLRDGRWFQKLLQAETDRMEAWCQQMDQETKDKELSEEGELFFYSEQHDIRCKPQAIYTKKEQNTQNDLYFCFDTITTCE